ncbi:TrbI/VirB10 family protein [uncultured Tateyamaria sp.]|uniref:TrbI/VirB10 family protein n=1 Tax=uncultured Tateyamaria sp. TaxID=455651 RepID=UPI00263813A5|nr:TrbI/VirB10 family protein [uncultured Tateyamaria sp.]
MADVNRKRSQVVAISVIGIVVLGVGVLLISFMGPPINHGLPASSSPTIEETLITDRTSSASPEMSWITQGRFEMERLDQELSEQRNLLEQSRKEAENRNRTLREEYDEQILQQAREIASLKEELKSANAEGQGGAPTGGNGDRPTGRDQLQHRQMADGPGTDFIQRRGVDRNNTRTTDGIVETAGNRETSKAPNGWTSLGSSFALAALDDSAEEQRSVRTLKNYLPAGSYAPAVVLSGADAATNVSNRENPIPVLFRITGSAVSAAVSGRSPSKVNLKGCTVVGSATGDLSSERVKVRLVSMTCLNRHGAVLETKVSGLIAGSGKEGVRGRVVSREGPMIRNAFGAGVVGGLGNSLTTAVNSVLDNDDTSVEQALTGAGLGTISGGIDSAASTLADYYIRRAEQYQPVVSLYGGTKVELVFLEGVELGP